jgi:valyl-tRNA synthetase
MLSDRYEPQKVEKELYRRWKEKGYFRAEDVSTKPPFSVVLPPPNVTGVLHLGHALDHTLQDVLARWKRMSGFNVCWLPGTDHAGIATQSVVEKKLLQEGVHRKDLGREKFVAKIWEWKELHGGKILSQMERLGDSVDWDRLTFTLDEGVSKAVRKVFVELYNKHLIYRGKKLINWSTALESAISDLEVDYKEVKGKLYHVRYPFAEGGGEVVVATTRPETMLGDVAVAVHPADERYQDLIGKKIKLPLSGRLIPVIADEAVEKDFGSGVVKITPAHDFNDYEMGQRHRLEQINILNKDGTLNENAGRFQGLKVQEARKQVLKALEEEGFLVKEEVHVHQVGHCSRSGVVVEPYLSEQWFVKTGPLAEPAKRVVESGTITFEPESWTKTYLHWMNNIQDWCISRQLWWGHRIPAWTCSACGHLTVAEADPSACEKCGSKELTQDEDVLDTWFSSALWPFSTFGWPRETEALKTFYPTSVLVTGFDIIFFWVARMIMMGLEFKQDVPFRKVYIHGLIRDSEGKKMSKSVGNALDPVELIEEYGADSLRFTLMAQVAGGRDLKFSTARLEGYRNFMNKIWNATRFALSTLEDFDADGLTTTSVPKKTDLSDADQWILFKLQEAEKEAHQALENERFSDAANTLYSFVWHSFCDWYLEFIKPTMYGEASAEKRASQLVMAQLLNRIVRLLHPFIPFITEEIYQKLPLRGAESICVDRYPTPLQDKELLELGSEKIAQEMDLVREVITAIRNVRGENRIKPGEKIKALINPYDGDVQKILGANKSFIMNLGKLSECEIGPVESMNKCAVQPVTVNAFKADVVIPLEGLVDFEEEIKRLQKALEKLNKEQAGLSQRLSNKSFVENAPEDVVEQGRQQLAEKAEMIKTLQSQLARLS